MPDGGVTAVASAIATATATATGSAAAGAAVGNAVLWAASFKGALTLASLASTAITASMANQISDQGRVVDLMTESDVPRQLIIGRRGVGGSVVGHFAYDTQNGDHYDMNALVIALADHQVNRLRGVKADGKHVYGELQHGVRTPIPEFDADNVGGSVGTHRVWMTFYDGREGQGAHPELVSKAATGRFIGGPWTSEHRLQSMSYVVVEMKYDDDSMTNYPRFLFDLEGALLYDRRKDSTAGGSGSQRLMDRSTWAYTDNVEVACDHWSLGIYINGKKRFGPGVSADLRPYDHFKAAADLCDEIVDGESRYAFNGVITSDTPHKDVMKRFAKQMCGRPADWLDRVGISLGEVKTPLVEITDADLTVQDATTYDSKKSYADLVTAVEGKYADPAQAFEMVDYPRQENPDWTEQDGGEPKVLPYDLPDEISVRRAQRIALHTVNRERRQAHLTETLELNGRTGQLESGDWFVRKSDTHRFDADGKQFECIRVLRDIKAGTVTIVSFEVDPTDLAWQPGYAVDPPPPPPDPDTIHTDELDAPEVTAIGFLFEEGGTKEPALRLTITNVDKRATRALVEIESQDSEGQWTNDIRTVPIEAVEGGSRIVREAIGKGVYYRCRPRVWVGGKAQWGGYAFALTPDQYVVPGADVAFDFDPSGQIAAALDALDQAAGDFEQAVIDAFGEGDTVQEAAEFSFGILEQSGGRNLIRDPLNRTSSVQWLSHHGVVSLADEAYRGGYVEADAASAGEEIALFLADEDGSPRQFETSPRARLMLAVFAEPGGVAEAPLIRVSFQDADDAEIAGADVELADDLGEGRIGGFVDPDEIPADAVSFGVEVAAASIGAGAQSLAVTRPFVAYAGVRQANIPDFVEPEDETVTRVVERARATERQAAVTRGVEYQAENAFSRALTLEEVAEGYAGRIDILETQSDSFSASIGGLQEAVTDLEAGKASVTAFNQAVARIDAAEDDIENNDLLITSMSASITGLDQAVVDLEAGKAEASTVNQLTARVDANEDTLVGYGASITGLNTAVADLDAGKAEASTVQNIQADVGDLEAAVTINNSAIATLNLITATRIERVTAGSAWAGIAYVAQDGSGGAASEIRQAAQRLRFGKTFTDWRFEMDFINNEIAAYNADRSVKTFELDFEEDGRVRMRADDGTLLFDSSVGVLVDGLPPQAVTQIDSDHGNSATPNGWTQLASPTITGLNSGGVIRFTGFIRILNEDAPIVDNSWRIRIGTTDIITGLYTTHQSSADGVAPKEFSTVVYISETIANTYAQGVDLTALLQVFAPSGAAVSGRLNIERSL